MLAVQVNFRTTKLKRAYEDGDTAARLWGKSVARKYVQRLEVLYAATNFAELQQIQALRAHQLKGSRKGQWALDLTDRSRLIVAPSGDEKAITVLEVTEHYGN